MLCILTRTNKWWHPEHLKQAIRHMSGVVRGPRSVLDSLDRGLKEISTRDYLINPKRIPAGATVHVMSGVQALKDALKLKQIGHISKLIAGPNIVVTPVDYDSLIINPLIDTVLVPSKWIENLYELCDARLKDKTSVWPAGVQIPEEVSGTEPEFECLVFKKNVPEEMYQYVINSLKKRRIDYRVIVYGDYKPSEYFNLLLKSKYMIYLQNVESQGLAVQEAWARNIPTLVWNTGTFTYPNGYTVQGDICAPYLSDNNGKYFKGIGDFDQKLGDFIELLPTFRPREDCIERLSDKTSAEAYIKIVGHNHS